MKTVKSILCIWGQVLLLCLSFIVILVPISELRYVFTMAPYPYMLFGECCKFIEFMGVETHYLPISNFRLFTEPTIFSMIKNQEKGRKAYGKFLKSQGISRAEIEKSDKAYVFYDYYSTGKSFKLSASIP